MLWGGAFSREGPVPVTGVTVLWGGAFSREGPVPVAKAAEEGKRAKINPASPVSDTTDLLG